MLEPHPRTENDDVVPDAHPLDAAPAPRPRHPRIPGQVQHVFHSGWTADSQDALHNADVLREQMRQQGLPTRDNQWSVYSDPREEQVLKEKHLFGGEAPPTPLAAALQMAGNTLGHTHTMWHGHSQGAAQITTAANQAVGLLAGDPERHDKAVAKTMAARDGGAAAQALEDGLGISLDEQAKLDDAQLADLIAQRKAEKKLSKYNMFSYSGAAMYPPEFAADAHFNHRGGDPVSGVVAPRTSGPSWGEKEADGDEARPGRQLHALGDANAKYDVTNHEYERNYAVQDARNSAAMLGLPPRATGAFGLMHGLPPTGIPAWAGVGNAAMAFGGLLPPLHGGALPPPAAPLPPTTPGLRVADGQSRIKAMQQMWGNVTGFFENFEG